MSGQHGDDANTIRRKLTTAQSTVRVGENLERSGYHRADLVPRCQSGADGALAQSEHEPGLSGMASVLASELGLPSDGAQKLLSVMA